MPRMRSAPMNAETSIINVDFGRWKFVINASEARNAKPGVMKMSVAPSQAAIRP